MKVRRWFRQALMSPGQRFGAGALGRQTDSKPGSAALLFPSVDHAEAVASAQAWAPKAYILRTSRRRPIAFFTAASGWQDRGLLRPGGRFGSIPLRGAGLRRPNGRYSVSMVSSQPRTLASFSKVLARGFRRPLMICATVSGVRPASRDARLGVLPSIASRSSMTVANLSFFNMAGDVVSLGCGMIPLFTAYLYRWERSFRSTVPR